MASTAADIGTVITWIVTLRAMRKGCGRPAIGIMTNVALYRSAQMPLRLTCGSTPIIIMAIIATTGTAAIVCPCATDKGRRGMAEMAIKRG